MKTSEQINELATALAKAQFGMKNAMLNKTNPHFKSRYADLAAIRDAVIPELSMNGIAAIQGTHFITDMLMVLSTRLLHSSGQWIESEYPIVLDPNKPQVMGSALTYARRYSLAAICGIAAEEDDDANAASKNIDNGKPTYPKARSREPYAKLETALREIGNLDEVEAWWKHKDTLEAKSRLPFDWQVELFASFMKQGIKCAESHGAQAKFWADYREDVKAIPDDEQQSRHDLIETYKEAQAAWDKPAGNGGNRFSSALDAG